VYAALATRCMEEVIKTSRVHVMYVLYFCTFDIYTHTYTPHTNTAKVKTLEKSA
jgi:hypothetical protein